MTNVAGIYADNPVLGTDKDMAMRLSNKARIARRAAEALRAAEEKRVRPPRKIAVRPPRSVATKRVKLVWKVFNDGFKEMACFPFSKEAEAKAKAAALAEKTGKPHVVNGVKVPMTDAAE